MSALCIQHEALHSEGKINNELLKCKRNQHPPLDGPRATLLAINDSNCSISCMADGNDDVRFYSYEDIYELSPANVAYFF